MASAGVVLTIDILLKKKPDLIYNKMGKMCCRQLIMIQIIWKIVIIPTKLISVSLALEYHFVWL